MALDPVYHISTVGGAKGDCTRGVDIRNVGFNVIEALYEVDVGTTAPVVFNSVLEGHAVPRAASWVGGYHNIPLFCEDSGVPSGGPAFIPGCLGLIWVSGYLNAKNLLGAYTAVDEVR